MTLIPAVLHSLIAAFTSGLTGSLMQTNPKNKSPVYRHGTMCRYLPSVPAQGVCRYFPGLPIQNQQDNVYMLRMIRDRLKKK